MPRKKKLETNDSFEKINEMLETTFDGEEVEEVKTVLKKKESLVSKDLSGMTLEEAEYMKKEIKNCVSNLNDVITKLGNDIKLGSPPRMFEVYATLANVKITSIKELRELDKTIVELKFKLAGPLGGPKNLTVNNFLSNKEVAKLIEDAKSKNSLNEIKADFKITDEGGICNE